MVPPSTGAAAASAFVPVESANESLPPWAGDDFGPLSKLVEGFEASGPPAVVVLVRSHPLPPGRRRRDTEAAARTGSSVAY